MSSFATTTLAARAHPLLEKASAYVQLLVSGLVEGFIAHRTYRALSQMRDDQLAEIGIEREDIAHVAMFGRTRHQPVSAGLHSALTPAETAGDRQD